MNMLAHRHLPPTPQDAAIARVSGQALSRFARARAPLKLRVTDSEQMEPIELPAGAVSLLMEILEAMAAGRGVTIIPENAELSWVGRVCAEQERLSGHLLLQASGSIARQWSC